MEKDDTTQLKKYAVNIDSNTVVSIQRFPLAAMLALRMMGWHEVANIIAALKDGINDKKNSHHDGKV